MPNKTAKPVAKATVAKPAAAKAPASKPAAPKAPVAAAPAKAPVAAAKPAVKAAAPAPKVEEKKVVTQRQGFKANEFVVYPAHGVGQILAIEEQEIAGAKLELFVINFIKDKMTLRVPTAKVANVGMRKLSEPALVKKALETLKGRARVKRTMWSRRAQEYEAKINSGDIVAIAEVVRDLYRSESQPEQSYSERQLYEAALDRLSREIAVVQHSTETEAVKEIEAQLAKSPRRNAKAEAAEGEGDTDADGDTDETDGDGTTVADEAA
jgi:CarD family transcriptional regulator